MSPTKALNVSLLLIPLHILLNIYIYNIILIICYIYKYLQLYYYVVHNINSDYIGSISGDVPRIFFTIFTLRSLHKLSIF